MIAGPGRPTGREAQIGSAAGIVRLRGTQSPKPGNPTTEECRRWTRSVWYRSLAVANDGVTTKSPQGRSKIDRWSKLPTPDAGPGVNGHGPPVSDRGLTELLLRTPDMDDLQRESLGFVGQLITEDLTEQFMDNGVEAFLAEPVTVLL